MNTANDWEAFCAAIRQSPQVCDCCKRLVPRVRGSMWHGQSRICAACFYVWYDGVGLDDDGNGSDPAKIAATVLAAEAQGTWPFERGEPP